MSKIEIKNLSKSYGNMVVLDDINMEINQGEFISLLGFSGCGKTTLLKTISGLEDIEKGQIIFDNVDVTNAKIKDRNAIIVFQDYSLFPHLTVFENIAYGLKVRKVNKNDINKQVTEMLKFIELSDKKDSYPRELSGGQKQRVSIARSLVVKPSVILLDEPFSGLDSNLKSSMRYFVKNIVKEFNITTIMVTHDKDEALSMSDRVAILINGKMDKLIYPNEIYKNVTSVEVARFLAVFNIVDCKYANIVIGKGVNKNYILIKHNHISIFKGGKYKIKNKLFFGEFIQYDIVFEDINLTVISEEANFNIDDKVDIKISDYQTI